MYGWRWIRTAWRAGMTGKKTMETGVTMPSATNVTAATLMGKIIHGIMTTTKTKARPTTVTTKAMVIE